MGKTMPLFAKKQGVRAIYSPRDVLRDIPPFFVANWRKAI